ncbi:MAG: SDR family oxidoreductase [Actinobacteria bacterium]|nr:SDR family oxidoreductase [Actinomycetota bacterium]
MDLGLRGKVAIVTGGARNIGAAIVRGFHLEGAHVVIADILGAEARELAEALDREDCRVVAVEADVRLAADMERMAAGAVEQFGRIDVLVNNAAVVSDFPFLDIAEEEWDRINDTNVKGIYLASRAVLPHMVAASHGRIVNISSRSGKEGQATMPHYAASKFAAIGLTQSMAKEMAPHGIHVNAVCPGILRTAMWETILDARSARQRLPREEIWQANMSLIPLRRPQTPDDIAHAVLFLSSDLAAGNITGEALSVNGGLRMD